jgi:biopolymer transport protein ExbD
VKNHFFLFTKTIFIMKRKIFMLLSFVFVTLCLSAQSLVFHLPDGGMSTVKLPATFTVSPSGDKLIIESTDARVELEKNRILAMIYQAAKGDVNDDTKVDVADIATVIDIMAGKGGEAPEEKAYTTCPDDHHPHLIDLGLPSGTKWACCNVGASTPEGYGNYYAWGETSPKSVYDWDTYQYGYYNYDGDYSHLVNIGSDIAGTGYDAATANWGSPWRMPSQAQIEELLNNTTSTWTTQNGVNGRKFTGSNGGTVFLPAAGYRDNSGLYRAGSRGNYWSSALTEGYPYYAWCLSFGSGGVSTDYYGRYVGRSVRPLR